MSRSLTDILQPIIHKRSILLIAVIAAFGYLASVAASPVASLFLTRDGPPRPPYSSPLSVRPLAITDHSAYSWTLGSTYSTYLLGDSWGNYGAWDSWGDYGAWETPYKRTSRKTNNRKKETGLRPRANLYSQVSEQRVLLAQLESEAASNHLLELIADSNLLLMLNRRITNHLNFINKRLNPPSDDKPESSSYKGIALGGKIAANVLLDAPNIIDFTQTGIVQVSIDWTLPAQKPSPEALPVIEPKLESPDFKIVAGKPDGQVLPISNFGSKQQTWVWLISPEKTGDREMTLSFSANGKAIPILIGNDTKDHSVLIPIKVLTELGLTSTQTAWAKAIGAIIGIVGTIAGYSFWRYRRRKKEMPEDNSDDEDDFDDAADAKVVLRELARYLREQDAKAQSADTNESTNAEGQVNDQSKA